MNGCQVLVQDAGLAGLAAAIRLAVDGCRVTAVQATAPPPVPVITMPLLIADLFSYAGEDVRDHLQIERIPKTIELPKPLEKLAAGYWRRTQARLVRQPGTSDDGVIEAVRVAWWRFRTGGARTLGQIVDGGTADKRVRDDLRAYAMRVGRTPETAPARLLIWAHVEREAGLWRPVGDDAALEAALRALAQRHGVEFLEVSPPHSPTGAMILRSESARTDKDAIDSAMAYPVRWIRAAIWTVGLDSMLERVGGTTLALLAGRRAAMAIRHAFSIVRRGAGTPP